jgi:hypothetical protein
MAVLNILSWALSTGLGIFPFFLRFRGVEYISALTMASLLETVPDRLIQQAIDRIKE